MIIKARDMRILDRIKLYFKRRQAITALRREAADVWLERNSFKDLADVIDGSTQVVVSTEDLHKTTYPEVIKPTIPTEPDPELTKSVNELTAAMDEEDRKPPVDLKQAKLDIINRKIGVQ